MPATCIEQNALLLISAAGLAIIMSQFMTEQFFTKFVMKLKQDLSGVQFTK